MHRSDMIQTCTTEEELWHDQEDSQQETTTSATETVTMRQLEYRRDCVSEGRSDSPARLWSARPVSLSSASSSDSGVRGDMSDASSNRLMFTGFSGDSGCAAWDELDEDDWECCSDASGEYEPLREPLVQPRSQPAFNRSLTHPLPPPPPPPPRPPPGTLPRRKDLTRHLGLPRELGGSLAELRAVPTARRKDLGLFLGMAEPSTPPPRAGLWRRWASRRGQRPERERERSAAPVNGSLPDLARLASGGDSVSMPSTPCRRRAAASPRLLRSALRKVQERALRAVARSGTTEVAGLDDGEPTLVFQGKRGSFEAPSVLFSGDRWQAPVAARPSPLSAPIRHKPRLPTPPPEPPTPAPSTCSWGPSEWAAAAEERLPPPLPDLPPPADDADDEDDPAYMTMEAIRALTRPPLPPPRVTVCCCADEDEESGYLSMDTVRQLVRSRRATSPVRPRLGSDYANLADLRSALAGLRLSAGSPVAAKEC